MRATRLRLRLSTAVALLAILVLTLVSALSGCGAGASASGTAATSDTVPPYYAETTAIKFPAYDNPLIVSIRDTATDGESTALRALPPYQSISFVVGTGKPNLWIVGAQRWHPVNDDSSAQPAKLYLATMDAETIDGNPFNVDGLTPLPVAPLLARQFAAATVSPNGKRLALVTTQADTYQVSTYPVTGHGAGRPGPGRVRWRRSSSRLSGASHWSGSATTRRSPSGQRPRTRWLMPPPRCAT